jgi:hypothetical protein
LSGSVGALGGPAKGYAARWRLNEPAAGMFDDASPVGTGVGAARTTMIGAPSPFSQQGGYGGGAEEMRLGGVSVMITRCRS